MKENVSNLNMPQTRRSIVPVKAKGLDLKKDYRLTMQSSLATAILVVIGIFHISFDSAGTLEIKMVEQEVVEIEEIQQTMQQEMPPPPPRPMVPIAVADDTFLEDDFLDLDASLDLNEPVSMLPGPPPPPPAEEEAVVEEDEMEVFAVVEEMPEIIGGVARLNELVEYPRLAQQAGVEGLVVVQVVVEPDGGVSSPQIVRSAGNLLDEAALKAVVQLRFKPGKQRGRPVRVSYAIPVRFHLQSAS